MGMWWSMVAGTGIALVVIAAVAGILLWRPVRASRREAQFERLKKQFHQQRERLEARFFELAAASGKPRGLRWTECDFDDDVAYARDKRSGALSAFVSVTIAFEAIPGGLMEDVEAVGNLRAATAVFHFRQQRWQTDGRAVFNLSPTEAIAYYHDHFEMVGREVAQRR